MDKTSSINGQKRLVLMMDLVAGFPLSRKQDGIIFFFVVH
jgi:hypothetical protein